MEYIPFRDAEAEDMAPSATNDKRVGPCFEKKTMRLSSVEDLQRDGFWDHKLFHCYVAESNGR